MQKTYLPNCLATALVYCQGLIFLGGGGIDILSTVIPANLGFDDLTVASLVTFNCNAPEVEH